MLRWNHRRAAIRHLILLLFVIASVATTASSAWLVELSVQRSVRLPAMTTMTTTTTTTAVTQPPQKGRRRRSPRLLAAMGATVGDVDNDDDAGEEAYTAVQDRTTIAMNKRKANNNKRKTRATASVKEKSVKTKSPATTTLGGIVEHTTTTTVKEEGESRLAATLPRTMEMKLRREHAQKQGANTANHSTTTHGCHVMGIDEAGRGPLAGPVVAAAVCFGEDTVRIPGIVDSKKITKEEDREALYHQIVVSLSDNNNGNDNGAASSFSSSTTKMEAVRWAVAVVDARCIDRINILQATLLGMRLAADVVTGEPPSLENGDSCPVYDSASIDHTDECYVVCRGGDTPQNNNTNAVTSASFYALVDGNRLPDDMPTTDAHAVVKGDGREYCIAAASILAKVTRDRLMHAYHVRYPAYDLARHKGYPTKAHRMAVQRHGASAIHRRTFAPLKTMRLHPVTGKVLSDDGNDGLDDVNTM